MKFHFEYFKYYLLSEIIFQNGGLRPTERKPTEAYAHLADIR